VGKTQQLCILQCLDNFLKTGNKMAQVIVYTNDLGGVTLTIPAPEFLETHTIEDVLAKDCPDHAIIVDRDSLPNQDNDFFNSWELNDGVVTINLDKAKEQTKERLRYERKPLLEAQDVLFQRALEAGADTTTIVAEKNRLRDITKLADTCTTTAELRALSC
jgi:hypothetical protein